MAAPPLEAVAAPDPCDPNEIRKTMRERLKKLRENSDLKEVLKQSDTLVLSESVASKEWLVKNASIDVTNADMVARQAQSRLYSAMQELKLARAYLLEHLGAEEKSAAAARVTHVVDVKQAGANLDALDDELEKKP